MRKTDSPERPVLDLRGLRCPLPALRTQRELSRMRAGETLLVFADDPLARLDIAHLCASAGHDLAEAAEAEGYTRFRIRRGGEPVVSAT